MPAIRQSELEIREALGRAATAVKRGDLEEALRLAKAIVDKDPRNEIALGMQAGIYAQLKMPERAAAGFQRILDVNPGNVLARFQLGLLLLESGQPQSAVDTWAPALSDPDDFLVHFHSALALQQLGRKQEALTLLERAERRMPAGHELYPSLRDLKAGLQG